MGKIRAASGFGLGAGKSSDSGIFSVNHFASSVPIPTVVKAKIASLGLVRVSGSVYECPSTRDLWAVKGGKILKLTGDEVDQGESIQAAPDENPQRFLSSIMGDIEW